MPSALATAWQFATMLHVAEQNGWTRFVTMQNYLNLLYREEEREMLPLCEAEGIGVIPWSPLAGGLLTGKYARGKKGPKGSRYEKGAFRGGEQIPDAAWDAIEGVEKIAKDKSCAPDAFALA